MKENSLNITHDQSIISTKHISLIKQMVREKQLFNETDGQPIINYELQRFVILPLS